MEMDTMNDAELTILSLLAEADRYAHEIQAIIEDRGMRAWVTIGFSSVYYVLNKLERQNMIATTEHRDEQGVARKHYRLTDAGHGVLQTAIADLLRQPRALGSGFELGLVNLNILKPRQVYRTLTHHRSDLKERLRHVEAFLTSSEAEPTDPKQAMYTHSAVLMRAELDWLDNFLKSWQERYPASVEESTNNHNNSDVSDSSVTDSNSAKTQLARQVTPNPAKRVQKMKRPKKPDES